MGHLTNEIKILFGIVLGELLGKQNHINTFEKANCVLCTFSEKGLNQ